MKLYYFETPNSRKACAVAKHLGAPVQHILIDLGKGQNRTPDFLAINPNGKVPALEDGSLKLWEANAIMCYFAEKAGSDVWPSNPMQRIEVVRWLSWDIAHFSNHAGALFFEHVIKPQFGIGDPDPAVVNEALANLKKFASVLDGQLAHREYVAGSSLTVADFSVAAFLPYAERSKFPLETFPNIQRWEKRMNAMPAWQEPFPVRAAAA